MKKEYTKTGKCIWCGKSYPDVTFLKQPHIVPRNMGGSCIGFDICDECNDYFGTPTKAMPSTNLVFKEVFNAIQFFSKTLHLIHIKIFILHILDIIIVKTL